jgi:hypothetical protein
MISEKTVELNLTAELLNWLWKVTARTHYVIAPSQREEARLGFDAGFHSSGPSAFIQFKRAYRTGAVLTWKLNRTADEDQHQKLQQLEATGVAVFYAFPLFSEAAQVAKGRRRLLLNTVWVRPSALNPSGGPVGPHDLIHDTAAGTWTLASPDSIRVEVPANGLDDVGGVFQRQPERGIADAIEQANRILFSPVSDGESSWVSADFTLGVGLCLIGTEDPE